MQIAHNRGSAWIKAHLISSIGSIIEQDGATVDTSAPFAEMGVDSFRVLKVIKRLESDFGPLPKTLLFENVNIDELATYFLASHGSAIAARAGLIGEDTDPPPKPKALATPSAPTTAGEATAVPSRLASVVQPTGAASPAGIPSAVSLPQGPLLLLEEEARAHPVVGPVVADIHRRYKNEAGASRGARSIAPNVFIGRNRSSFFNYARSGNIILAYAYSGADDDFAEAAAELLMHCRNRQLQLNVFADRVIEALGATRFSSTPFGALQRITGLSDFTLEGRAMRRLRYQVSKFEKAGVARTVEYRLGGSAAIEREIAALIDRWCAGKPMVNPLIAIVKAEILENTLDTLHRLFLTYVDDVLQNVILIAPLGPAFNGYLMDLEFYDSEMPLGGLEFAITRIAACLVTEGCELLSLGGTYGCRLEVCAEADPDIDRVLDDLHTQGIFNDDGNLQFKNKFRPENRTIYLCRPVGDGPASNVTDIIMMIADPAAMQTPDVENHSRLLPEIVPTVSMPLTSPSPPAVMMQAAAAPLAASVAASPAATQDAARRAEALQGAGYNPLNIAEQLVPFDLRTDSWGQLRLPAIAAQMDHLRAQLQVAVPVEDMLRGVFPFAHFVLTTSGRAAEEIFYASQPRQGGLICNLLFPSGLFNQIDHGFDPVELPRHEALQPASPEHFKGDLALDTLRARLAVNPDTIALVCVEASNNATGGQPVSLGHLRALKALLAKHGIPLVLDATRIIDNAYFLIAHEPELAGCSVWEAARKTLALADAITCSLMKNFGVDRGGLIATHDPELFARMTATMAQRGGGLNAIDRKLVALALQDRRRIETQVARRIETVRLVWSALSERGLPLAGPVGGHCVLIDVRAVPAFRDLGEPVASFLAWLYLNTGIRGGAHSVGMQKGTPINDLVRLAIPIGLRAAQVEQLVRRLVEQFAVLQNIPDLTVVAPAGGAPDPHASFVLREMLHPAAVPPPILSPAEPQLRPPTATPASLTHPTAAAVTAEAPISGYLHRDIAVIGMAGRYPKARNLDELWRNLAEGRDCIENLPAERLAQRARSETARSYRGGFIDDIDRFDSLFFNISPRDSQLMDPQERLFLEVAWEAMEDAGYCPDTLAPPEAERNVGVFVGAVWTMYQMFGAGDGRTGSEPNPNSFLWSIANHVSYCLNLSGPSMTVDTACSSSLTALHLACESIYRGECTAAIVGGVNLDLHPGKIAINLVGGALSEDGVCRSFGKGANGYVAGEGIGAILIKPLEDAVRDGDPIHGVIKGVAVNHGGRSNGYAVPNPRAQSKVIQAALARAGLDAGSLTYIEAHGTGTELGDPVEIRALGSAFETSGAALHSCAIGSVKTNIGHLEAAAGVVGVCKVLLQMRHGLLAPSLHSRETNDFIDFRNSPFYVVQDLQPWLPREADGVMLPLRAGVSSFGAGGSNAHVILESYARAADDSEPAGEHIFPLSARSEPQLRQLAQRLSEHLRAPQAAAGRATSHDAAGRATSHDVAGRATSHDAAGRAISHDAAGRAISHDAAGRAISHDAAAIARTLQLGRKAHEHRAAIVASDIGGLIAGLDKIVTGTSGEDVATGNTGNSAAMVKLLNTEEQDQFTRLLSHGRDNRRLARLWADGVFSRWHGTDTVAAGRRAALPSYPFADRRHWISSGTGEIKAKAVASLHPMLDSNESTFERQLFRKRFHGGDFFIYDHLVSNIPTLPGVAYLEFARKAGEVAAGRPVRRIRNILWLSPISVRDDAAQDVLIELKPKGGVVQFDVFSLDASGARKTHAQGQLLFTGSDSPGPEQLDLGAIQSRAAKVIDGRTAYPHFDAFGLHLGPSFQVLREIYSDGDETLGRLSLSPARHGDLADIVLHPALVDGSLQAGAAAQLDSDAAEMAVPYSIGEVEIFGPLPAECWSHVTLVKDGKQGASKVRRANVTITDTQGRVLVCLRETVGVPLTEVHAPAAAAAPFYYVPTWNEAALGDDAAPLDGLTLWFDTDTARAARVPERLHRQGGSGGVVLVAWANGFEASPDHIHLDPSQPEHFRSLIQALQGRPIRQICLAGPLTTGPAATSETLLNDGVLTVLSLCQALATGKLTDRICLVYAFATPPDGQPAPEHEAVAGFAKALRLEHPKLLLKTLELRDETAAAESVIDRVLAECRPGNDDAEAVRYDGAHRLVRRLQPADRHIEPDAATALRDGGTYLITGGGGALGLLFADHLARTCTPKLILTGRSQPSPALTAKLADLQTLGAEILYLPVDVADRSQLRAALDEARLRFGPIHGVIHAAGVLRDSYVRNKTLADMQAVLAPKVVGTINLDAETCRDPLDFFVLFSSMSAVGGNPGQCDYCFANAFMDSFAARRDAQLGDGDRQGRTLSVNWSLWADGGMRLDAQSEQVFRKATGIRPLEVATGLRAFAQGLAWPYPQLVVVQGDRDKIETSWGLRKPPQPVAAAPATAEPTTAGAASIVGMLRAELSAIAADFLKLTSEDLQTDKILLDLGFDSIGLASFANMVNERFDLEITPILFFDYPSIDDIAKHLAAEHQPALSRFVTGGVTGTPAARHAAPPAGDAAPAFTGKMFVADEAAPARMGPVAAASYAPADRFRDQPIAIVGMSGVMPQSADLHAFWQNLRDGRDLVGLVPPDRWSWEEHFGDPLTEIDKTNSKWGGFMTEVDKFDPLFFGISPREAQTMDPQQRLFLQNVWEAVEDSGHRLADLAGTRTGLFVGVATSDYVNLVNRLNIGISAYTASGNSHAVLANRVSFLLNLRGPSAPIDTACSSSLIALHRAIESIHTGSCDMAIVGGVQVMLTPAAYVSFSMAGMLSPDGKCKSFDKSANGYVRGEGSGAILIKPLAKAEADGDHIYAVVRATVENHGGRVTTLTAPNASAQAELLVDAYTVAEIDPSTVGFIECHGTGTSLGDPIEVQGLVRAFGELYKRHGKPMPAEPHCGLSSVKTNIGHLETAAGIAGILTTLLAIKHAQIPANLHFDEINPYINLKGTPFYVADRTTDWEAPRDETGIVLPRRAGISSFGFGGANAHVVLEEYHPPRLPASDDTTPHLVVLSAKNEDRLRAYAQKVLGHLDRGPVEMAGLAYTLQVGRDAFAERLAFVADSPEALRAGLQAFLADDPGQPVRYRGRASQKSGESAGEALRAISSPTLSQLAEAWVAGAEIDWTQLHPRGLPRRQALPTYPFARERCWIQIPATSGPGVSPSGAAHLHPLVHRNVSTLQAQTFATHLTGTEFFLRDHMVEGQCVLPGVGYIEMARVAGSLGAGQDVRCVRNLVWLAPLVVSGPGADIEISLVPRQGDVAFTVISRAQDRVVTHCTGLLGFEDATRRARSIDLDDLRRRVPDEVLDGAALYRYFEASGLSLGPTFRIVDRIWANESEALALLHVPAEAAGDLAQFGLHPGLMDGALHVAIGLMKRGDVDPPLSLPFSVGEIEIFGSLQDIRYGHASWAPREGQDDPNNWKVDFQLLDGEGRVLCRLQHFASKALHRGQSVTLGSGLAARAGAPPGLTAASSALHALLPVWSPAKAGDIVMPPTASRILVVGADRAGLAWLRAGCAHVSTLSMDPGETTEAMAARLGERAFDQLVWIAPDATTDAATDAGAPVDLVAAQDHGVMAVFQLTKALLAAGYGGRALTWTLITARTQPVYADDATQPAHASVFGYVGCLAKEYPHWSLRLLDIESLQAIDAATVLSMPCSRAASGLVHRRGAWLQQELAVLAAEPAAAASLRQGGIYVVIGGAGGIGEAWSRHLAETYQAQTIWIGRRSAGPEIDGKLDAIAKIGPRPLYIAADATDPAALARAREHILSIYPAIHGVVHSALVLRDQSIAQMDRASFAASLRAKVDISVAIDRVFGALDLDFLLFFSSIITFGGAAGQSNYAAGCAFKDGYARALQARRPYPVKVMNWGFWGNVGVVADDSHRRAMAQLGMGSIEPAEGWSRIDLLLGARFDQMAVLKTAGTLALPSLATLDRISYATEETAPVLEAVRTAWVQTSGEPLEELRAELPSAAQDRLVAEILLASLRDGGWIAADGGDKLSPQHRRWLDGSRQYLQAGGWLGDDSEMLQPVRALDALWQEWFARLPDWTSERPHHDGQSRLLQTCLEHLPEILSGTRAATEILFSGASFKLVESIYRGNPLADHYNALLGETLAACIERVLQSDGGRKLRILEIGAGTGGTTSAVLPILARFGDAIVEYCFSDVSKAFLTHAARQFQPLMPVLTTAVFDVSQPLDGQAIGASRFDIVIAANVLHATPDIRATIRHAKAAMKRHGVLLLNEISTWSAFSHLTFGLLDGWWCFESPVLRLPHSPGLAPAQWAELLVQEGFDPLFFPAASAHSLGQQIVAAASDGIIRRSRTASPRSAAPPAPAPAPRSPAGKGGDRTVQQDPVESRRVMGHERIRQVVAEKLSQALQLETSRLGNDEPFAEYGVDSIVGVSLVRAIAEALEIELEATALFEYSTINQLTDHIHARFGAKPPTTGKAVADRHPRLDVAIEVASTRFAAALPVAQAPRSADDEPIAIIGMSGRFAESDSLEDFWRALSEGRELIKEVSRWQPQDSALEPEADGSYCRHGSFIDSISLFDAAFFRISADEARHMDPQQRLFLEEAWTALEDAGYANKARQEKRCGVFVGCGGSKYDTLMGDHTPAHTFWGNSEAVLPARIAYYLDLHGPAIAVNTSCSSSLVTIHMACQSLRLGETTMCLAGGVFLQPTPGFYQVANRAGMLSPQGRCFAFDPRADGFVPGEGVGVLVLKRLSDAQRDGDQIHGVIIGSAINQDGASNGIIAPNAAAQERLECEVYDRFDIDPASIQMLEAHGTGTKLGDAIEFAAATKAFRKYTDKSGFCALGSVKTNIGHAATAAGVAGVIKVLLSLRHGRIPASLNHGTPNPAIDLASSPFFLADGHTPWPTQRGTPRRAAISAFGFSGTNAHVVIEEAPATRLPRDVCPAYLIALSARTGAQLAAQVRNLAAHAANELSMADASYTLLVGRTHMSARLACVVRDRAELVQTLGAWLEHGAAPGLVTGEAGPEPARPRASLIKYGDFCIRQFRQADAGDAAEHLGALAELFVQGCNLDYDTIFAPGEAGRISLPSYPFAREHYWVDAPRAARQPLQVAIPTRQVQVESPTAVSSSAERIAWFLRQEVADELRQDPAEVALDLSFFDLGVTSLGIAELVRKANVLLEIDIAPAMVFEHPTIASLATVLSETYPMQVAAVGAAQWRVVEPVLMTQADQIHATLPMDQGDILRQIAWSSDPQELAGYEKLTF